MAFGFFKKVEAADLILHNGHVFTQNPELPWASAVACKGEEIMAVGNFDDMSGISDYAYAAVSALAGEGIINGTGENKFSPKNNTTRAEAAVLINAFMKGVK